MRGCFAPLLVECTTPDQDEAGARRLRELAGACRDWDAMVIEAEAHGLAPLLRRRLESAGVRPPRAAARALSVLGLKHRDQAEARRQVLAGILERLRGGGIEAMVLKGAALAPLVYGETALRPMADIDVLVPRADAVRAQALLERNGFERLSAGKADDLPAHHHLPGLARQCGGLTIVVEVHHDTFSNTQPATLRLEADAEGSTLVGLDRRSRHTVGSRAHLALDVGGTPARGFPPDLLLWQLCLNVVELGQPMRLIQVADIARVAARFEPELDWECLARDHPSIVSTLALLDLLVALPAPVAKHLPHAGSRPAGVGVDFDGVPRRRWFEGGLHGLAALARDTLLPPEWWLRLYYGKGLARGWRWPLTVRHAAAVAGAGARFAAARRRGAR